MERILLFTLCVIFSIDRIIHVAFKFRKVGLAILLKTVLSNQYSTASIEANDSAVSGVQRFFDVRGEIPFLEKIKLSH